MTSLGKFLMVAAVALTTIGLGARVGSAAPLTTSPVWADTPAYHSCNVANVGTTPFTSIKIEMVNSSGTVVATNTVANLAPGRSVETFGGGEGFIICRFTPVGGINSNLRANTTSFFYDASTGTYVVVGFSEAR